MEFNQYKAIVQMQITELVDIHNGKDAVRTETAEGASTVPFYNIGGIEGYTTKSISELPCIAIGVAGTVGKPKLLYPPYWVGGTQIYITPKFEKIDMYWLLSHINGLNWKYFTNPYAIPPKMVIDEFKELYLETPPYEIMQEVGTLYKNYLREIELCEILIGFTDEMKEILFHLMFGGSPNLANRSDDPMNNMDAYYQLTT